MLNFKHREALYMLLYPISMSKKTLLGHCKKVDFVGPQMRLGRARLGLAGLLKLSYRLAA
jgi:hypothetical protein